jgi:hypothetical protein
MVSATLHCHIKVLMPVLTASLLHADFVAALACRRPPEEKFAALALSISEKRGGPHASGLRRELYVGEIRDAPMSRPIPCPGRGSHAQGQLGPASTANWDSEQGTRRGHTAPLWQEQESS